MTSDRHPGGGAVRARLGVIALCALLVAPAGPGGEAPQAYGEALELYRAGEFAAAAARLERAIESGAAGAAELALLGWCRLHEGRLSDARVAFRRAAGSPDGSAEAWTGLGYVALREQSARKAHRAFRRALDSDAQSADAWKGLGLALRAADRMPEAVEALRRAVELAPEDAEARQLLERTRGVVAEERRPRPPAAPEQPLRAPVRAVDGRFVVDRDGAKEVLFVRGVNLSTALPGRFPGEFPDDPALYREWFRQMGQLGANAVRLYTLHPPSLYRALAEHNAEEPERHLWLIQGVWCEAPPGDDFGDPDFVGAFHEEIRRVIDAVHGNLELPARPGRAHGVYETDLSEHLLAFVIGREWEPFSIAAWHARGKGARDHAGRFVRAAGVQPIEAWLAEALDVAAEHETHHYRWQHPLAFSSWPTLDPLHHPTEASYAEEMALQGRLHEIAGSAEPAFDDDAVQVDPTVLEAGPELVAGLFASYHVYPYHPDFMILEPRLAETRDEHGPSRYLGYLLDLVRHHGTMPVLIAEYGVPSSRGISHLHPEGLHHGGHTPAEQARINLRLQGDIERAGMAGGIVFAWIDEWFKKNWLTAEFESPRERDPLWLNVLDPEEHYGLIAALPGAEGWRVVLDGSDADWHAVPALYPPSAAGVLGGLRATSDEAYLYLRLDVASAALRELGPGSELWIGIDTYDAARGDHRFPAPAGRETPLGLEFLMRLGDPSASRLLVDRPYDLFGSRGRPFRSVANSDGAFVPIVPETNRERHARDGTRFPALRHDRSLLRHGSTDPASADYDALADWYADAGTGRVEARIPWGLLQVADPSSRRVIHDETRREGPVATVITEGFRFHVLALGRAEDGTWQIVDALPSAAEPRLEEFPLYRWPTWDVPTYRLEPKESYEQLRRAWSRP